MPSDPPPVLVSPNSVLANALLRPLDVLRPALQATRPQRLVFLVGTQINGAPHLGTSIVQAAAFLLAQAARRGFSLDTRVRIAALDNAPFDVTLDPATHHAYQLTYHHLGNDGVAALIDGYYRGFLESLADATDVDYDVETYTEQQATAAYRAEFLRTLERLDEIRWWLAPSHGVVHVRLPCPRCAWAEKRAERTRLVHLDDAGAVFSAVCMDHDDYEVSVDPVDGGYLDLATLYRNLVKERALGRDQQELHVMVKGGDWAPACGLVDRALAALGTPVEAMPPRIFTPQVLTDAGGKLSKSQLREAGLPTDVAAWMLDTAAWDGSLDNYVDALIWLVGGLLADPKHFFRPYTTKELARLMSARPPDLATRPRVRDMRIYKRYFDLIRDGRKTIEVRVGYSSMQRIRPGQLLRFTCHGEAEACLTRVVRVARYHTFKEMFDHEEVSAVHPTASREEQLASIQQIFPPEKERLGVIAIEVERVAAPGSEAVSA